MITGLGRRTFRTIVADPPWRFQNRYGKVAPEYRRLKRYRTMSLEEILGMDVAGHAADDAHLYLWIPNAMLPEGLQVLAAWGFEYKTNIVWYKTRADGGPDGSGVGFYFRNATELLLMGVRGRARTKPAARSIVNVIASRKRDHSRKPDEVRDLIAAASPGPYLELFARGGGPDHIKQWTVWGDEAAK